MKNINSKIHKTKNSPKSDLLGNKNINSRCKAHTKISGKKNEEDLKPHNTLKFQEKNCKTHEHDLLAKTIKNTWKNLTKIYYQIHEK